MGHARYTATSRGWLAFFGLIYAVLLVVFGVGLGLAMTLGDTDQMIKVVTDEASLTSLQQAMNKSALSQAAKAGVALPQGTQLIAQPALKRGIQTGMAISANFGEVPQKSHWIDWDFVSTDPEEPSKMTLKPLLKPLNRRLAAAAKTIAVDYSGEVRVSVEKAIATHFNTIILDTMMTHGIGIAYPMLVLICQTAAIVGAILGGLVLLIMRWCAHSWERWLRVAGRLTYIIALLAGLGALMAAIPALGQYIHLGGINQVIVQQVQAAITPTWQRLAGVVALIGLAMAGAAALMRMVMRKQVAKMIENEERGGAKTRRR
ncbi:hypothetical protein ACFQ3L_03155 [Lacticaseibacillus jixianensis]|uniref:ABC transporter permease n=1 Tax=Lacticaseibacillus jixianensis TaxID=2486012 RepID=A0ABW4B6T3_9LACO|nr:hypothetical protein [Lacticaseibacillus jixianensis]